MQAIRTKFVPWTNTRPSRIKAIAQAGSVTLNWDHGLTPADNHKAAAMALVRKYKWFYGEWMSAELPDGSSAWVCAHEYRDNSFNIVETTEEEDGTNGQDRDCYSDDQDRDSYST